MHLCSRWEDCLRLQQALMALELRNQSRGVRLKLVNHKIQSPAALLDLQVSIAGRLKPASWRRHIALWVKAEV